MPSAQALLYLASQSPRRRELLAQLGIQAELLLPDASEDAEALEQPLAGENPLRYVSRVTRAKGQAAWKRLLARGLKPAPILVADTTVALGQTILGKPATPEDAHNMLTALSGQWHRVLTCVVLQTGPGAKDIRQTLTRSDVLFAPLSPSDIRRYVDTGEPMDKAGAYGIQGGAAAFVVRIRGSYTGIIGLPLYETGQLLNQAGICQHE
jgi:septum formation protein